MNKYKIRFNFGRGEYPRVFDTKEEAQRTLDLYLKNGIKGHIIEEEYKIMPIKYRIQQDDMLGPDGPVYDTYLEALDSKMAMADKDFVKCHIIEEEE